MRTYRVPHTDLVVSRIGYGCGMIGFDWNSPDFVAQTVPIINTAYEQGITLFDTADVYASGKSEMALGEVLRQAPGLRQKIVIQSKCGQSLTEPGLVDSSREYIRKSVEGSLQRLRTDRLDIFMLHWPDGLVEPEELAKVFDELHRAGKVRYFGVSNHTPAQIELLRKYVRQPLVANQIQLGLGHWYTQPNVRKGEGVATLDYCRAHEMQVQAYSPLKAGNIMNAPSLLNPGADAAPAVKKAAQNLADIASGHGTSAAGVMLAWLLRHPAGIVPIIGATKAAHVIDNCAADGVELSRSEWYSLLRAVSQIEPPAGRQRPPEPDNSGN